MSAVEIIEAVHQAGGTLRTSGGRLKVSATAPLSEPIMAELRARKAEVIDFLNRPVARVVQKALDSLARYLQMFTETLVVENVFRVVQEMDDDELDRRLAELERALGEAKALGPASVH